MNDTMKLLDQAFVTLCDISVKGADVERMAMAKGLLHQAAESLKARKNETGENGAEKK